MNQKENMRQKQDLRVLMEHFDNGQMDRYEAFRRSGLTKSAVRKVRPLSSFAFPSSSDAVLAQLVNQVLQQSVSPTILTVVRGFAKVFVGEIVEKGTVSSATSNALQLTIPTPQPDPSRTTQDPSHPPTSAKPTDCISSTTSHAVRRAGRRCLCARPTCCTTCFPI